MAARSRRFERLAPNEDPEKGTFGVSPGGMCLSAFLLVSPPAAPGKVLLGKIDPSAPWDEIGALDAKRRQRVTDLWMLPSCHLLEFEGPVEAARRIATEQLERPELGLQGPEVASDVTPATESRGAHWDLHFIFRGTWGGDPPRRTRAFRELAFLDARTTDAATIARGGADILELAGLRGASRPTV